jgi:UDP-N-acetylglucosamine 2-epimerase (non-hydrolysing)
MIDTLYQNLNRIRKPAFWDQARMESSKYILLTLHRPSNVDDPAKLKSILHAIMSETNEMKVLFPVHPRTKIVLEKMNGSHPSLIQIEPQGYLEFIYLLRNSMGVVTDSGGITEEATVLGIPCMTLRNSTERPETVEMGTNELIGSSPDKISAPLRKIVDGKWKKGTIPELWDGQTSERIIKQITEIYSINGLSVLAT